jgi:hypothetical protein
MAPIKAFEPTTPPGEVRTSRSCPSLERHQLERIAEHYPRATIVKPAGRFGSMAEWSLAWPRILAQLDWLVFFGDDDGCRGRCAA